MNLADASTHPSGPLAHRLAETRRLRGERRVCRYAPSPTGPLHLGNVRTALLAWLQCRLLGGVFIMRMEDLDRPRARPGAAESILEDLRWLGLDWDEGPECEQPLGPYTQSERDSIYASVLAALQGAGHIFPCYCSRKDIRESVRAPHGVDGPVYPGTCRHESGRAHQKRKRPKRQPALRIHVPPGEIWSVDDEIAGSIEQDLARDVGDFVLRRTDGLFAYQLAVVVDDALMGITDILRGADLLDSSPRQAFLFRLLGSPIPRFWHVPLLLDDQGARLSKRDGSTAVATMRAAGTRAPELVGQLAFQLGLQPNTEPQTPRDLLAKMNLNQFRERMRAAYMEQIAAN